MSTYSLTLRIPLGRRLTNHEMDNNFLYLENLISMSQGDQGSISYSTDEVSIGNWVDGKPIYRKVLHIDCALLQSGTYSVDNFVDIYTHNLNIETYIRTDVVNRYLNNDRPNCFPLAYNGSVNDGLNYTNNDITISGDYQNLFYPDGHLILEYTKII